MDPTTRSARTSLTHCIALAASPSVAPVFYDLVKTAAWRKEQEERNTLKDLTKVSMTREFVSQEFISANLWRISFIICQAAFS